MLDDAVGYITKYIEKTGEKIVYSRGLPQFFIADVLDDAIVCPLTPDEKKFVLFDNFECFDEGCLYRARKQRSDRKNAEMQLELI